MSNQVSYVRLLFDECNKNHPNMTKINEYIIRCCNKKEDINSIFQDKYGHRNMTPLHIACRQGHHEIVMRLLDKSNTFQYPIDDNAIGGNRDETPLHIACQNECPLTVRTLLLHPHIDVNICDGIKGTPLHIACGFDKKEIVIELLKHSNINLNAMNEIGATPFHLACSSQSTAALVQLLLEHGTIHDINAVDKNGNTPLHFACLYKMISMYRLESVIQLLLQQPSIMINKKNNKYETPIDIIKKRLIRGPPYEQIFQLFEDYRIQQQRWHIYCFLMKNL